MEVPNVVGLTSHNAPRGIDFRRMKICSVCLEIRGPWMCVKKPDTWRYQKCACERKPEAVEEGETLLTSWQKGKVGWGFDFNTIVELCQCCGFELLESGSKFSVWFCSDCKERVRRLHELYQQYIIPIGRHSIMGSFGLSGKALRDEAEVLYFCFRYKTVSESIRHLMRFANLVLADNLARLGFTRHTDIELTRFLYALRSNPLSKEEAFARLCKFFEIE